MRMIAAGRLPYDSNETLRTMPRGRRSSGDKAVLQAQDRSLNHYLKQIAKNEPLSSKQEAELAIRVRAGDKEALETLVLANLRFVVSVAHTYKNQGLPLSDLVNEGNLGLIRAAKRFDEKKNFRFISYAVWWIRQAILQALAEQSRIVRLPLNRVSSIHKIGQAQSRLQQRHQRVANTEEIAEEIGEHEHNVQRMIRVGNRHTSLDAPFKDGNGSLYDTLCDDDDDTVEETMTHHLLRKELARSLAALSPREKDIIMLYFGIGHSMSYTLDDIGARFDLTRERVRQIKERALRKLKDPAVTRRLREFSEAV